MSRVHIYRNLHRKDWSLRGKNGRVESHQDEVCLSNCKFVVWQGIREKVVLHRKKLVHAFVRGDVVEIPENVTDWVPVTYNPYYYSSFVRVDNKEPVRVAKKVFMTKEGKVFALCPS